MQRAKDIIEAREQYMGRAGGFILNAYELGYSENAYKRRRGSSCGAIDLVVNVGYLLNEQMSTSQHKSHTWSMLSSVFIKCEAVVRAMGKDGDCSGGELEAEKILDLNCRTSDMNIVESPEEIKRSEAEENAPDTIENPKYDIKGMWLE